MSNITIDKIIIINRCGECLPIAIGHFLKNLQENYSDDLDIHYLDSGLNSYQEFSKALTSVNALILINGQYSPSDMNEFIDISKDRKKTNRQVIENNKSQSKETSSRVRGIESLESVDFLRSINSQVPIIYFLSSTDSDSVIATVKRFEPDFICKRLYEEFPAKDSNFAIRIIKQARKGSRDRYRNSKFIKKMDRARINSLSVLGYGKFILYPQPVGWRFEEKTSTDTISRIILSTVEDNKVNLLSVAVGSELEVLKTPQEYTFQSGDLLKISRINYNSKLVYGYAYSVDCERQEEGRARQSFLQVPLYLFKLPSLSGFLPELLAKIEVSAQN